MIRKFKPRLTRQLYIIDAACPWFSNGNGIAIAVLTAAGVLVWSSSTGLALVIGVSMVIAMVAAAFLGW